MKITYKIEGKAVDRNAFRSMVNEQDVFDAWEKVVEKHKDEIESRLAGVVFKINNKQMHVLTETELLFKLMFYVNKEQKRDKFNFPKQFA